MDYWEPKIVKMYRIVFLIVTSFCMLACKEKQQDIIKMPYYNTADFEPIFLKNKSEVPLQINHTIGSFSFLNQDSTLVTEAIFDNKIHVANFIFTSCGSICPKLTTNMARLQQSFMKGGGDARKKIVDTNIVYFMSLSVDPIRDSVRVLRDYANRMDVISDNWWLLTGNRDSIYNFIFQELRLDKFSDEPVSPDFVHTSRFVLIDKNMHVRGYYKGLDSASLLKLAKDVGYIMLEKDKKKKSEIFQKIVDLSWLWLIIAVLVGGFVYHFSSTRQKN